MDLKKLLKDSRLQVALILALVWLLAVWSFQTLHSILYPLFAVGLMTALDVVYTKIRFKKWYWPSASFVTGFLIGLILSPTEPIWVIAVAVLAAFISKQFIGLGIRRHIFNPAAFGIMAVSLIFGTGVSWWGVAWSRWPLLVLIPVMLLILWKLKRLFIPLTFLLVYFVYLATQTSSPEAAETLLDGSVMLFALVMLTEPITSPNWGYFKYLFGALVAVLAIVIASLAPISDNFPAALLAGNLIGFLALKLSKNITSKLKSTS